MATLTSFLQSNKQRFLDAVQKGKGDDWTIVMGNEAGDLDSIASAIAYSYLATNATQVPTIALVQTRHSDLALRAENLYAFSLASLDPGHTDLLCIEDLPASSSSRPSRFALVDHNRLAPSFTGEVVGVIDHHADENLYKDAKPRYIVPGVGSCASLVTRYYQSSWALAKPPPAIASLLICAILLDTGGLHSKGKTTQTDIESVDFLFDKSTLIPFSGENFTDDKSVLLADLTTQLASSKASVSHLSTRDLLRRDYKEYDFVSPNIGEVRFGLVTVPLGLKPWVAKDPHFWEAVNAWMEERALKALGVLNSFISKKGHHRRQAAFVVRNDEWLASKLWRGLEHAKDLDLQDIEDFDVAQVEGRQARVWKQGNVHATRKVIAPLLKEIIEE